MNEQEAHQRWALEHTVRRPDCHAETSTDLLMSDLTATQRENSKKNAEMTETISRLVDQLEIMEADLIKVKTASEQKYRAKEAEHGQLLHVIER